MTLAPNRDAAIAPAEQPLMKPARQLLWIAIFGLARSGRVAFEGGERELVLEVDVGDDRHRRLLDDLGQGDRAFEPKLAQRAFEPGEMRLVVDETSVDHGRDLIDAIGEEEAPVENRDAGVGEGRVDDTRRAGEQRTPLGVGR